MKIVYYKFHKHEAFYLYGSGDGYSIDFSGKILSCILHKHEAFYLCASGDVFSKCLFVKIVCHKHYKHKAFHLCASGDEYSRFLSLKVFRCKFYKCVTFHFFTFWDDFSKFICQKIRYYIFNKQKFIQLSFLLQIFHNNKAFHLKVSDVYLVNIYEKILYYTIYKHTVLIACVW